MLLSLSLTDFVIVPELTINLEGGFTALTGETGAGKSILIDALQLLLGARADTVVIREGAKKTEVSGIFSQNRSTRRWLTDNGFEPDDDEILMRRVLDASGRSQSLDQWLSGHGKPDEDARGETRRHPRPACQPVPSEAC